MWSLSILWCDEMPTLQWKGSLEISEAPGGHHDREAGRAVDTVEQRVEFVIGEEKKKCEVQLSVDERVTINPSLLFTGSVWSKSSTVGSTRLPSLSLSTRKRRQIWWRKISIALVYVGEPLDGFHDTC